MTMTTTLTRPETEYSQMAGGRSCGGNAPVARTPPTPASASRSTNPSTGTSTRSAAAAATVASEASTTTTHQTWSRMDHRRAEPR